MSLISFILQVDKVGEVHYLDSRTTWKKLWKYRKTATKRNAAKTMY